MYLRVLTFSYYQMLTCLGANRTQPFIALSNFCCRLWWGLCTAVGLLMSGTLQFSISFFIAVWSSRGSRSRQVLSHVFLQTNALSCFSEDFWVWAPIDRITTTLNLPWLGYFRFTRSVPPTRVNDHANNRNKSIRKDWIVVKLLNKWHLKTTLIFLLTIFIRF